MVPRQKKIGTCLSRFLVLFCCVFLGDGAQVCCGGQHAAVLTDCGEIYTWGRGGFGRLGHGNRDGTDKPRRIETLEGIPCVQVRILNENFTSWRKCRRVSGKAAVCRHGRSTVERRSNDERSINFCAPVCRKNLHQS